VQDGCSHGCAFCIVPSTRGRPVSRAPEHVLAEVERLFRAGHREVVLSGINLRQYGQDLRPRLDFWDLARALDAALAPAWQGLARLRLSSLDPAQLTSKGLDTLASSRLLCPHLHLSIQSGSPSVLARMNRPHYAPSAIREFLDDLKSAWPLFGLGADLLTGFPGETDDEARETLEFCRSLPLTYAHVFPYSRRPGTVAAAMEGQVEHQVKKARSSALRGLAQEKKTAFLRLLAGLPALQVAVQEADPAQGVCQYYAQCRFTGPAPDAAPGGLAVARPLAARRGRLAVEAP
jgi:MiaB/RimO family radical SAM methylthiotransferase